ncbi:MAG: hypothetical protein VW338_09165 [Rhodospirillaceae bacterium]
MASFIQPSFAGGELAPELYGRVDIAKYHVGLKTARNVYIRFQGGASNRAGLEFVGPCKQHDNPPRLVPFQFKAADTYALEFGDQYMRVVRAGGHVLEDAQNVVSVTNADPAVVEITGHGYSDGDEVYAADLGGITRLNGRRFVIANKTTDTFELTDQVTGANIDSSAMDAYTSGGTFARVYTVSTPWAQADLRQLKFVQSADTMTVTHPDYDVREITRTDHDAWTVSTPTFAPVIATPTGGSVTPQGTTGATTYNYKVTAIADETFEESLPTAALSTSSGNATLSDTNFNRVAWSAVSGATKYDVYKDENGLYGYIGSTESTQYDDTNYEPDLERTPPQARNPFSSTDDKPGAVSYYEQRRVFGGSNNSPDTNWYTRIGNHKNLTVSNPGRDDDAITATLNARQVNEIRHYVPLNDLIILTAGAEWKVNSGGDSAFAASTIKQKPQSYWGSSHVPPIVIGGDVLFVEESGSYVLSLTYQLDTDSYRGPDMTLLSSHLFEGYETTEWAFAKMPYRLVHTVRDDGESMCLAFNRDQEVVAWTHWDTDGDFESVCAIRESTVAGREDAVYYVVERSINGNTVRYIERLHSRYFTAVEDCFFVDSGVTYDGSAATTITGLDHLEGESVVALADGNVVRNLTVTDGAITLATAAAKVHVGLGYTSDLETLDVEAPQGTIQGKLKKISKVVVRFLKSRGLFIGPDSDNLVEMKQREFELMGNPTDLLTGTKEIIIKPSWNTNGRIFMRQSDPLPMTILAVVPELTVGG